MWSCKFCELTFDRHCTSRFSMFCGGQKLQKVSEVLLDMAFRTKEGVLASSLTARIEPTTYRVVFRSVTTALPHPRCTSSIARSYLPSRALPKENEWCHRRMRRDRTKRYTSFCSADRVLQNVLSAVSEASFLHGVRDVRTEVFGRDLGSDLT